jgi:protein involved in polysaccharide export with SLBB domain
MPIPPSSSPAPAELARAKAARASFLTRITQFPAKHVSVVPYAPERLSITQDVFTPTMQETLLQAVGSIGISIVLAVSTRY